MKKIILNIRKIMEEKNLSARDIEPYMPISDTSIYRIFTGKKVPDIKELLYFSEVLEVPIESLYEIEIIEETGESEGK